MGTRSPIEALGIAWIAGAILAAGSLIGIFFRNNKES